MVYYLAFRDVASSSIGVTVGEVYSLPAVPGTDWRQARLAGANWVPWAQVADVFRNKHVLFVLHGFNVDANHGIKSCGPAAQEYEALGNLGLAIDGVDLVVPVLWPGDGLIGWSWFNAYGSSAATGAKFADFLTSSAFTGSVVSFFSHSLGARVVLETIAKTPPTSRFSFDTAVLTAAAVDDNALDDPQYAKASAQLKRIVVVSSMKDEVLKVYFTIGSAVERALWRSYDGTTRALGRYGPAFADASPVPQKTEWYEVRPEIGQDHGDYLPAGWNPPLDVWSPKQQQVGWFSKDAFDQRPFRPDLPNWGIDHTPAFRPGWPPNF
jgi:hypothetical protein